MHFHIFFRFRCESTPSRLGYLEQQRKAANLLFPVRVDKVALESEAAWACDIKISRHIGDFSRWKNHDAYSKALDRLLRDLKAGLEGE